MSDSLNPQTPEAVAFALFTALKHTLPKIALSDPEGFQRAALELYADCLRTVRRASVPQSDLGPIAVNID
jgi:hypothetical protein